MALKVFIATSCRWFSAARLAMAFQRAGCVVDAACPPRHPVLSTRALETHYRYRALAPLHSLRSAILSSRPDLIVPSDDLAMLHLHRLYNLCVEAGGDDARFVREAIRTSLGEPAGYSVTGSQNRLMAVAREENIQTPQTQALRSIEEMERWLLEHGFPAVLKADGTSGGEGVRIVQTMRKAVRAYRTLHAPLHTAVVAKRACLDGDWNSVLPWLWQRQRRVSIQSFVTGPDANIAVSCWEGEVLSSISARVLKTWIPKGPATLIRLIENEEMLQAATKIVRRLKFSGLCGFDFMMDEVSGAPLLIEMNARATQTCALPLGPGKDLIASLCSTMTNQRPYGPPVETGGDTIALFPLAWQGDTSSELFQSAYHDIPWEEPGLVRLGLKQARSSSPREKWSRMRATLRSRTDLE